MLATMRKEDEVSLVSSIPSSIDDGRDDKRSCGCLPMFQNNNSASCSSYKDSSKSRKKLRHKIHFSLSFWH